MLVSTPPQSRQFLAAWANVWRKFLSFGSFEPQSCAQKRERSKLCSSRQRYASAHLIAPVPVAQKSRPTRVGRLRGRRLQRRRASVAHALADVADPAVTQLNTLGCFALSLSLLAQQSHCPYLSLPGRRFQRPVAALSPTAAPPLSTRRSRLESRFVNVTGAPFTHLRFTRLVLPRRSASSPIHMCAVRLFSIIVVVSAACCVLHAKKHISGSTSQEAILSPICGRQECTEQQLTDR